MLLIGLVTVPAWCDEPLLGWVTQLRTIHELPVLGWDDALAASCRSRAQELATSGRLVHQDEQGRGPGDQLLSRGFPPGVYGEVLGAGKNLRQVWAAWLASPPHRAVLLDPRWVHWGWGSAPTGTSTVWVLRFQGP